MATPESKVKKQVKEILKNLGAYYVMPVTSGYGNSGAPDFLVCIRGKFIGIECKAGKGKVTALQQRNLDQIDLAGGWTFVINEENVSSLVNLDSLIK
jgi:Holliday junction resolvase